MQLSSSKPIPASHDMNVEKVENPTTKKVTITIQDSSPHPLTKVRQIIIFRVNYNDWTPGPYRFVNVAQFFL